MPLDVRCEPENNVDSADQAVDKGVLWALPQTQIIGGDLFLKRAIQNGQWQTVTELLGDLQIASDYEKYLQDEPVIDAAIASSWNGLAQADKDFYSANQGFMTRAISMTQLPLTGGDVAFYQANQAQVDRIIAGISVSSFAAGWITTIARATELKLDQYGPSDFFGGMAGFLQSFGVAGTESAKHYEDFRIHQQSDGALTITGKGQTATDGTFAILPGHIDGPTGNDVTNPRGQQGLAGWDYYSPWGATAFSTDLPGYSGNGNDVLYIHMLGSPNGNWAEYGSAWMPSVGGDVYEASVRAAAHRSVAVLYMQFLDTNGNNISIVQLGAGGRAQGGGAGDLNNFDILTGMAAAPAGTAYRRLLLQDIDTGGDPYAFFTRPESHDVTTTDDLRNPRFLGDRAGWTLWTIDAATAQWGTDLGSPWSGSGNDSLWLRVNGQSAGDSIAQANSERLSAVAGQAYQVSVLAAQHRGLVRERRHTARRRCRATAAARRPEQRGVRYALRA